MSLQPPVTQTPFEERATRAQRAPARGGLLAPIEALLTAAREPAAPVLRRLRLVGAIGSRIDALFHLRAAELRGERGAAARARLRALVAETHALLGGALLPALRARGVVVQSWNDVAPADRQALARSFVHDVSPLLTPLTVDATHPFPCVASLALSIAVLVREPRGGGERYVGIEVPPAVARFQTAPGSGVLVPVEELIGGNLASLLPGLDVVCQHAFRATRDGRPLRARGRGAGPRTRAPVRLEVAAATPPALRRLLATGLGLDPASDVDESPGLLDLAAVAALPLGRGPVAAVPHAARGGREAS